MSGPVLAQTSISGTLKDAKGDALSGANIYVHGTYDGASSNLQGQFILESLESGEHTLCIEFIGFKEFNKVSKLEGHPIGKISCYSTVLKKPPACIPGNAGTTSSTIPWKSLKACLIRSDSSE